MINKHFNREAYPGDLAADLSCVAAFLAWMPDNEIWGARRAEDVREAFARLMAVDTKIYEIMRGAADCPPDTDPA